MPFIGQSPPSVALTSSDIADGIISNAKLAQDIISADTALGATPADTDEFLVSDAGTLKRMDYSHIKAGSDYKLLATETASADTSISFDGDFTADYSTYVVELIDIYVSVNNATMKCRFRASDADLTGSSYIWVCSGWFVYTASTSVGTLNQGHNADTSFALPGGNGGFDNDAGEGVAATVKFWNPLGASNRKKIISRSTALYDSSRWYHRMTVGEYMATTALSGITFYPSSGNITGVLKLYGIK